MYENNMLCYLLSYSKRLDTGARVVEDFCGEEQDPSRIRGE
jgi:hypothetical protein